MQKATGALNEERESPHAGIRRDFLRNKKKTGLFIIS